MTNPEYARVTDQEHPPLPPDRMPPDRMQGFRRTSIADPIHGLIQFNRNDPTHELLLAVINSKPFQRLRRVKQMGVAEFVFPGATHSRFAHCLGSTHLMMQALDHFNAFPGAKSRLKSVYPGTGIALSQLLLLGILVHDIGHAPLSHTLEDILDLKKQHLLHDQYWNRKILTEDPELQALWQQFNPELPEAVLNFTGDGAKKHFLGHLISSQLDMDRLDYLQRDSHFLGVQYGRIEAPRIITNMVFSHLNNGDEVLAVREEAVPAIEHYLFGRHQAYKMALHSLDKSAESLFKKVLERFKWAHSQGIDTGKVPTELYTLMTHGKALDVSEYLRMDDCYLWEAVAQWAHCSADPLLATLANRVLRHDLFKFVNLRKYDFAGASIQEITPVYDALREHYAKRNLPFEFCFDETLVQPKPMYQPARKREPIWILTRRGRVVDLQEVSSFSLSLKPDANEKLLLFVWDKTALNALTEALEKSHLTVKPLSAEALEEENEDIL